MSLYNKRRKKLLHRLEVLGIIPSLEEAYEYGITKEVSAAIEQREKQEAIAKAKAEEQAKLKAKAKAKPAKPKRRRRSKTQEQ